VAVKEVEELLYEVSMTKLPSAVTSTMAAATGDHDDAASMITSGSPRRAEVLNFGFMDKGWDMDLKKTPISGIGRTSVVV
jgi:hypothetical protein